MMLLVIGECSKINPSKKIFFLWIKNFCYFSIMENYVLEGTPKSPQVNFNAETGVLLLSGRSIPENAREFYRPMIEWVEKYNTSPKQQTTFDICLEYFNTSSSKALLIFSKRLNN